MSSKDVVFSLASSNSITIERAEIKDAESLTEICKQAFDSDSGFGAPGPGGPPGYDSVEWNRSIIQNQYLQYYKVLDAKEIIGGFIAGDRGPGYQVCERIWVNPSNMRKGIGKKTFEMIWDKYPSADLWVLGTPEWNIRTNPFYQSLGFMKIGMTHDHPTWIGVYYEKRMKDGIPQAMSNIANLENGQQRALVEGKIEAINPTRTVKSRKTGEDLMVADAILADETGSIKLVLWNDQIRQVNLDTRIRIEEGFVQEYRTDLQLSVGKWGMIITLL